MGRFGEVQPAELLTIFYQSGASGITSPVPAMDSVQSLNQNLNSKISPSIRSSIQIRTNSHGAETVYSHDGIP